MIPGERKGEENSINMPSGGFWRKPVTRMYSYNLDLGEHYYSPMTSYLDTERGTRGETPGALTFSERLAKTRGIRGRRYEATELRDRYARSSSMAREATQAAAAREERAASISRAARAVSEVAAPRPTATSAWLSRREMQEQARAAAASSETEQKKVRIESTQQRSVQEQGSSTTIKKSEDCNCGCDSEVFASNKSKTAKMAKEKMAAERATFLSGYRSTSKQKIERKEEDLKIRVNEKQSDDINYKIAGAHMQPWSNRTDMQEAEEASARARARIVELERELEEITKKALMASSKSLKSAKQMAYQASMEAEEEAKASSSKKSKKVIIQSSKSIRG